MFTWRLPRGSVPIPSLIMTCLQHFNESLRYSFLTVSKQVVLLAAQSQLVHLPAAEPRPFLPELRVELSGDHGVVFDLCPRRGGVSHLCIRPTAAFSLLTTRGLLWLYRSLCSCVLLTPLEALHPEAPALVARGEHVEGDGVVHHLHTNEAA